MGHRVPSPREMAVQTQNAIQNSLLKKKKFLDDRENLRKRQELQQQQQCSITPINSPAKQTHSPTPLAFTPTSVLRKMTAEKEPEGGILTCSEIEQSQIGHKTLSRAKVQQRLNRSQLKVVTKLPRSLDDNCNNDCFTTRDDKSPSVKSKHMSADQTIKSLVIEKMVFSPIEKLQIIEITQFEDINNNDLKIVDDPFKISKKENSGTIVDVVMVGGKEYQPDVNKENVSKVN